MGQSEGARRSIRAQMSRIVLIPTATFLVLFTVLSAIIFAQAISLRTSVDGGKAGLELGRALADLQHERRLSAEYLTAPEGHGRTALVEAMERTDTSVETVRTLRDSLGDSDNSTENALSADFFDALDTLQDLRENSTDPPSDPQESLTAYTDAIHLGIRLYSDTTHTLDDGPATAEAAATTDLLWAREGFSHADALISSALLGDTLAQDRQSQITALAHDAQHRMSTPRPGAEVKGASGREELVEGQAWQEAYTIVDAFSEHEADVTVDPLTGEAIRDNTPPPEAADWRPVADKVRTDLGELVDERAEAVVTATEEAGSWMMTLALSGCIMSLFAATVAYGVAARIAGQLTFRLTRLRAETLGTARNDLPRIVRRLEAGGSVDLGTEMKKLDHGDDEVGQVADAFDIAQRTAVGAAIRQADIRAGVNRVFLGIAHRNQSLVQRQLQLLDRIEREEEDPDLLESLFQLDHLATRGRRHAENLIILGGGRPGRRWRHPIPLVDILRGAISETDEYARVRLTSIPNLSLSGAVVADVIHLLAELVENATAYSPPHTEVTISTETVPKGVAIEVEDRGLGMTEDALVQANTILGEAPEFDMMGPGSDARLGLFVVARLAGKHDIGAELSPSPYGGTRAVVLIPNVLVVAATETEQGRSRPIGVAHQETSAPRSEGEAPQTPTQERPAQRARTVLRSVPQPKASQNASETTDGQASLPRRRDSGRVGRGPGRSGLPRRKRQAGLVPQLRREDHGTQDSPAPAKKSPEQARSMMNAFSAGTRRGREGAESDGGEQSSEGQVGDDADDHTGESD